jgi:hypothetical protein
MSKVKKEIYAMGFRNPYRISVKPNSDWVYSAEVGPDAGRDDATRGRAGHDEINLTKPGGGFYGWPYCNGNNFGYNQVNYANGGQVYLSEKFDCANPVNESPNNTGITLLPAATAPIAWYAGTNETDFPELGEGQETGMVGPFYQYDPASTSSVKWPPYYHGKMIFWDWARFVHKMIGLNSEGGIAKIEDVPVSNHKWGSDIDIIFGANGAMYGLQWSTSGYGGGTNKAFYKVEYRGGLNESSCPLALSPSEKTLTPGFSFSALMGISSFDLPAGASGLDCFTWDGRKVWSYHRKGHSRLKERVRLPDLGEHRWVQVRIR